MNEVQKSKLTYFFSVLDSNGNQILQPDDFTLVAEKISDRLGYDKESKSRLELRLKSSRLFVQILADLEKEDVSITLDDWLGFFKFFETKHPEYVKRYITRIVHYIFSLFDHNNDLQINRQEYKDMFRVYSLNPEFQDVGFDKLDENGDQYISKQELIQGCYDFFLSPDPDAPGNWIFGNWRDPVIN